jgi:hypothetical protein
VETAAATSSMAERDAVEPTADVGHGLRVGVFE